MSATFYSIIGLPRSGKTTFLAALWHLLNAGEISTRLALDRLVGDVQHLNSIVDSWRRCEEVPRTSIAAEVSVAMHLKVLPTNMRIVLEFPDLSGESFEQQLFTRSCSSAYLSSTDGCGGILLFVNADRGQDGMTIADLNSLVKGEEEGLSSGKTVEWTPQVVPEQVRLVELLQFLIHSPFERRRRKLAVMISAWDVVSSLGRSPDQWLKDELPLLHQFLRANPYSFDWRAYGVSAQGGDVTGIRRMDLLKLVPSERVICVGPETESHDLTGPIVWLTAEV